MTTHKCDFCRAEISARPGEVTSVISYLPCFHVLCQACKSQRLCGLEPINCSVCNHAALPQQVFDLVVGHSERLYCRFCSSYGDGELSATRDGGRVEFSCVVCPDALYCGHCADKHREAEDHELKQIQTVILPRSQCSTHANVPAIASCTCGMRLCATCQPVHTSAGHGRQPYIDVAAAANIQLCVGLDGARHDMAAVQKQLAAVSRYRGDVRAAAAKARTAVASEIVELCNVLMRRGNDVVVAIDSAEEAKLKAVGRLETELKTVQQKLRKIECLLNMTVHSPAAEDLAAPIAAATFAARAQQLINDRKMRIQRSVAELRAPARLAYVSDLPPVLNALGTLGQLDVDEQIRTPPTSTPASARMFTVTGANGVSAAVTHPVRSVATMTVPPSTSAGSLASANGMTNDVRQPPLAGVIASTSGIAANKSSSLRPANLSIPPTSMSLPGGAFATGSPPFMTATPTSTAPFMNPMQTAAFLQQQQMRAFNNAINHPNFYGNNGIATNTQQLQQRQQQQQLMMLRQHQQQQQQQQRVPLIPTSQQQQQTMIAAATAATAASTTSAHQDFLRQQRDLFIQQQQQRQRNFVVGDGSQNSSTFSMAGGPTAEALLDGNHRRALQMAEQQQRQDYMEYLEQQKQRQIAERQSQQHQRLLSDSDQQHGGLPSTVQIFENITTEGHSEDPTTSSGATTMERSSSSLSPDSSSVPINASDGSSKRPASAAATAENENVKLAAKRPHLDVPIHATNGETERNPADFPTNSPSVTTTTTNGETVNGATADELRRPSSANSAVSATSSSSAVQPRPTSDRMNLAVGSQLISAGTSPTSLAPKLLLKKKATDGTYEAGLIECNTVADVKPNITVLKRQTAETGGTPKHDQSAKKTGRTTKSSAKRAKAVASVKTTVSAPEDSVSAPAGTRDEWDDYCYVCSQGCDTTTGDLGCCDKCPHVYHNKCHIPAIREQMSELPDNWNCTLCADTEPLAEISHSFNDHERLLCSKVILACFANSAEAEPFYHPVPRNVMGYYDVIKSPVCLLEIAQRLSNRANNLAVYQNVESFLDDMNLLFKNCSLFNSPHSDVAVSGRRLYALYRDAVRKNLPAYEKRVWVYVTLREENTPPVVARQRRGGSVGQPRRSRREESIGKAPAVVPAIVEPLQEQSQQRIEPN